MNVPDITDAEIAFGTVKGLPTYSAVPDQFKRFDGTPWNKLVGKLFFAGAPGLKLIANGGVDPKAAWRHCAALLRSFEPKHEHKEAGVAYLMSQYFKSASWEGGTAQ